MKTKTNSTGARLNGFWFAALLAAILALLFWQSFLPGVVHFSNDGPLGMQNARFAELPAGLTGMWFDLNSIGFAAGAFSLSISMALKWILGPVLLSKFLAPIALFILGMGAWSLFRELKFNPTVCALGGIAAALSSAFFSTACWGVATQQVGIGMNFFALALVISSSRARSLFGQFARLALAGAAVGISIMEGLDNGALFSLLVAAFTVYHAVTTGSGPVVKRLLVGGARTAVIAICAGFIAAQTLISLISTQITGVAGTGQDQQTKAEKWDWATQWSFPKREVLTFIVPGLFGYRMDTPDGGNYWGAVGRDPAWDRYFANGQQGNPPQGAIRFSGGGAYLGVPVALIALWAAVQAFRRKDSALSLDQRKVVWFWIGVGVVTLLLAFGRFAPFYRLFYTLPYFSTIRNPIKFTAIFNFAAVIIFAYGANGLWQRYVDTTGSPGSKPRVDRRWLMGCLIAIAVSVVGWLIFVSSRVSFLEYLQKVRIDEGNASAIAAFSARQVGWFIVFLVASVGLMFAIMNGKFSGPRAKLAGILLGVLLVVDLGRANLPWTVFWNYEQKYASNPIVDLLRQKPYEQRVAILPFRSPQQLALFEQLYRIEWAQHHFPYYNIQSLDIVQMPRVPQDLQTFETALQFRGTPDSTYLLTRRWALTGTRYLLGPAGFLDVLNQQIDPEHHGFRIVQTFNVVSKPGISNPTKLEELTAVTAETNGAYALFEFTGALPRAALFSNWQVPAKDPETIAEFRKRSLSTNELEQLKSVGTNDFLTLEKLSSRDFDPHKLVLVADNAAVPNPTGTNQNPGKVEYTGYSPKDIRLKSQSDVATILLLSDKYDSSWRVSVDGKPAELLRCNYIMRGVYLTPGSHNIEFTFRTDSRPMYVTLAAMIIAGLLAGYVVISARREANSSSSATV